MTRMLWATATMAFLSPRRSTSRRPGSGHRGRDRLRADGDARAARREPPEHAAGDRPARGGPRGDRRGDCGRLPRRPRGDPTPPRARPLGRPSCRPRRLRRPPPGAEPPRRRPRGGAHAPRRPRTAGAGRASSRALSGRPRGTLMTRALTVKQRKFVKHYVESGNATQAALAAYNTADPHTASAIAAETLENPGVQQAVAELLDANGLSDGKLLGIHARFLTLHASPDPQEKALALKALDMAYRLKGAYPPARADGDALLHPYVRHLTAGWGVSWVLWAKTERGADGAPAWHPLPCHLVDGGGAGF